MKIHIKYDIMKFQKFIWNESLMKIRKNYQLKKYRCSKNTEIYGSL